MSRIDFSYIRELIPEGSLTLVSETSNIVIQEDLKEQVIALIIDNLELSDENKEHVRNCIERFIGENATFSNLNILKHDLQWLCNYFTSLDESNNNKKNQKISMLEDLIEDMGPELCTEGFFNRVQNLVNIISTPKSFAELVSKVCMDLVIQSTSEFISNFKRDGRARISDNILMEYDEGYEIHYAKVFLRVAFLNNFGVPPQDEDPYLTLTPELELFILTKLQRSFNANFTEFYLFWNLFNNIQINFQEAYGYSGFGNYNSQESRAFYNFLVRLGLALDLSDELSEEEQEIFNSYFITEELEIGGILIHDLNWDKIRASFAELFLQKEICTLTELQKETFTRLFVGEQIEDYECLFQDNLFSDGTEFFYFVKNLDHLDKEIKNRIYFSYIKSRDFSLSDFNNLILQFIYDDNFLETIIPTYKEKINGYRDFFLNVTRNGNFFIEALESKNEKLIKLAYIQFNCLLHEDKIALLTHTNIRKINILMLAIEHCPNIVINLINILESSNDFSLIYQTISQTSLSRKTLFISATKHPAIFNKLFEILEKQNPEIEKLTRHRAHLLNSNDNSGDSILSNLIKINPELLESYLERVSNFQEITIEEILLPLSLFSVFNDRKTPLHIAAEENSESFMVLLRIIKNSNLKDFRQRIYSQRDSLNLSPLHYLTIRSPQNVGEFLQCLVIDLNHYEQIKIYEQIDLNAKLAPQVFYSAAHNMAIKNIRIALDIAKVDSNDVFCRNISKWKKRFIKYLTSTDVVQQDKFLTNWENYKSSNSSIFSVGNTSSSSFFANKRHIDESENSQPKRQRDNEPEL